jgi:hypothetical protein
MRERGGHLGIRERRKHGEERVDREFVTVRIDVGRCVKH